MSTKAETDVLNNLAEVRATTGKSFRVRQEIQSTEHPTKSTRQ